MEGFLDPEAAQKEAAMMRELHTPRGLKAAFDAARDIDVTDLLPQVTTPTLVLHRREGRQELSEGMVVASGIPGAGLTVVEGSAFGWALQDPDAVLQAIDDFVGWNKAPERAIGDGNLSPREQQVLRLLVKGRSAREIGGELVLGTRTVERHISNIYRKIGAHNRAQATAFALENRLEGRD
jgi:DNA-binding CsgD family transcriptional regulator